MGSFLLCLHFGSYPPAMVEHMVAPDTCDTPPGPCLIAVRIEHILDMSWKSL